MPCDVMEPAHHSIPSSHMRAVLRDDVCRGRSKPALQVQTCVMCIVTVVRHAAL